jgi:hypothetical protein
LLHATPSKETRDEMRKMRTLHWNNTVLVVLVV